MKNKVKALSPTEVKNERGYNIPDVVIEAVNFLLKEKSNVSKQYISFFQDELISKIQELEPSITCKQLYNNHWLDFEPIFEKVGWKVIYDKPAYGDNYEANFTFKPKK